MQIEMQDYFGCADARMVKGDSFGVQTSRISHALCLRCRRREPTVLGRRRPLSEICLRCEEVKPLTAARKERH